MADRYRILGQLGQVAAASAATLYTVPVPAAVTVGTGPTEVEVAPKVVSIHFQTLVTSIIVCNMDASVVAKFSITISDASDPVVTTNLFLNTELAIGNTSVCALGLTLSAGDSLKVSCSGADCDFTAVGIETTTGRGPNV